MNKTFLKYFCRMQLHTMLLVAFSIAGFIFIFTFADTIRKIPTDADSPIFLCIYLSILRVPYTLCELLGYIYLIAATFSLWNLSQSHQITVLRSIGKSSRQILLPYFLLSCLIGILFVFVLHPLCIKTDKFADYQDKVYLSNSGLCSNSVWMNNTREKKLIYFGKLCGNTSENLYITDDSASKDTYAECAIISGEKWLLKNGYTYDNKSYTYFDEKLIDAPVETAEVELYSVSPQQCDIYALLRCLYSEKSYATDVSNYVLNLNKILSMGVHFFLFSIIAALVCLPLNRYKTKTFVSGSIIGAAILLRLLNNICESMGSSGVLSPSFGIWLPNLLAFFMASALLIWKEE